MPPRDFAAKSLRGQLRSKYELSSFIKLLIHQDTEVLCNSPTTETVTKITVADHFFAEETNFTSSLLIVRKNDAYV